MRKPIVVSVIATVMLLAGSTFAPALAQTPTADNTPTFYHLVPGTYVNGWPRFTIHYPKDWEEKHPRVIDAFRVGPPGPLSHGLGFVVVVWSSPEPLDRYVDINLKNLSTSATDVTVVSDKPSQLRDGTLARENDLRFLLNGIPTHVLCLATKKGAEWVSLCTGSETGKTAEEMRAMIYSLEFQPGFDKPVKVPPDVQEFIDKSNDDYVSHDLAKYMTHFSDAYLNSGVRKGEMERFFRQVIGFATSAKAVITDFVPAGDRAHYAGFSVLNGTMKVPAQGTIIKENGEWRFYGNQRDAAP